jgi:hypothetical protein
MLFIASVYTISVFPVHWGREYNVDGPTGWEGLLGANPQAVLRLPIADGDGYGEINRLICQVTRIEDGPAECLVACNDDGLVVVWRTDAIQRGEVRPYRQFKNPAGTWSLALCPSRSLLATGSNSHEITLWDLASGALVRTLRGHAHNIPSLSFGPDGLLVSSSIDGSCRLWNARDDDATDDEPAAVLQIGGGRWVWSSAIIKLDDIHGCSPSVGGERRMVAQSQDFQAAHSEAPLAAANLGGLFEDESDEHDGDGRGTVDDAEDLALLEEEYEGMGEYFTDPADLAEIWQLADVAIEEQLHRLAMRSQQHRPASAVQAEEPLPRAVHRIPLPGLGHAPAVPVAAEEPGLAFGLPAGCGHLTVCLSQKEMAVYSSTHRLLWACEDVLLHAYGRRHYDWAGWRLQRFSLLEACPELSCLVAGNQCGAVVVVHFTLGEAGVRVALLGVPLFEDYLVSLKGMTLRRLADRPCPAWELFLLYADGLVKSYRLERRHTGPLQLITSNLP